MKGWRRERATRGDHGGTGFVHDSGMAAIWMTGLKEVQGERYPYVAVVERGKSLFTDGFNDLDTAMKWVDRIFKKGVL